MLGASRPIWIPLAAAAIAAAAIGVIWLMLRPQSGAIDFATSPQTVLNTNPFLVGETYTVGLMEVPQDVPRPVTIMAIEVLHSRGIEVMGVGAFDPDVEDSGVGMVPGWPPVDPPIRVEEELGDAVEWDGLVAPLVGVRTTEAKSGLRGIEIRWRDADGIEGSRVYDLAVVTCAPGACEVQSTDQFLRELGLAE